MFLRACPLVGENQATREILKLTWQDSRWFFHCLIFFYPFANLKIIGEITTFKFRQKKKSDAHEIYSKEIFQKKEQKWEDFCF